MPASSQTMPGVARHHASNANSAEAERRMPGRKRRDDEGADAGDRERRQRRGPTRAAPGEDRYGGGHRYAEGRAAQQEIERGKVHRG